MRDYEGKRIRWSDEVRMMAPILKRRREAWERSRGYIVAGRERDERTKRVGSDEVWTRGTGLLTGIGEPEPGAREEMPYLDTVNRRLAETRRAVADAREKTRMIQEMNGPDLARWLEETGFGTDTREETRATDIRTDTHVSPADTQKNLPTQAFRANEYTATCNEQSPDSPLPTPDEP